MLVSMADISEKRHLDLHNAALRPSVKMSEVRFQAVIKWEICFSPCLQVENVFIWGLWWISSAERINNCPISSFWPKLLNFDYEIWLSFDLWKALVMSIPCKSRSLRNLYDTFPSSQRTPSVPFLATYDLPQYVQNTEHFQPLLSKSNR